MKDIIISHAKDIDGVSPIILLKLCHREIDYHLLENGEIEEKLPIILSDVTEEYENIYITDLSLSENMYQWIETKNWKDKIHIFDHHISHSYATIYPYVTIDIEECATSLFFRHLKLLYPEFMNKDSLEQYVEHVLNLDLWHWVEKKDFLAKQLGDLFGILGNIDYIEYFYQKLSSEDEFFLTSFEHKLLQIEDNRIKRYYERKNKSMLMFSYHSHQMGVVFAENYCSELGMMLQNAHPELDFIAMINVEGGVSLRTQKNDIDLSEIATLFGGGGHRKASGFGVLEENRIDFIQNLFPDAKYIEQE